MKLHIGCGTVYLRGYVNVDLPCAGTYLATEERGPALIEQYITDESDYYSRHKDRTLNILRKGAVNQDYVCDRYGSFFNLPCKNNEVDEILARSVFEHLSLSEAEKALDEVKRVLKHDGIIRLDVPDHDETMLQFTKTGDDFFIRHLLGPRKTKYGYHCVSYTRQSMKEFLADNRFDFATEEPNIHPYPSFCLVFKKR